ncbi:MAG: methyltransferase domain-containing protein [Pseudolabrys sp.]
MNLHVDSNLALELPPDATSQSPARKKKSDSRAALASQFVPSGARVLDLSGDQALQPLLPSGCSYSGIGRSSTKRPALACDLDTGHFPTEAACQCDVIVMLGALEWIADIESLFTHLRFCKRDVIFSYCATDLAKGLDRGALGFANHLSFYDLALLFDRYGFRIECTTPIDDTQVLIRLTPTEYLAPAAPCSVAVIADEAAGNFGARLGCQMINALLPGEAEVDHLTFRTLNAARAGYDLVILGTGNGLFPPLLGEEVLDIVSRSKAAIGIFGTQGRELISRPTLDRLIDRLDTWFARYEDDVLMYGRGHSNVVHIGDWLIDQFPLTRAINDEPLVVDNELGQELALDRAISTIQRHKQVYSTVPTALLCALTSAELAAYAEIPAQQPDLSTGQFRSMLIDVFGRAYPEQKFFLVDRDPITRYKARVHRNVAKVGARIGSILRNVAVAA